MDDIWGQVRVALWALWEKAVVVGQDLLDAAWRKLVALVGLAADLVLKLAAKVAAVPWWVTLPAAVVLLAGCVAYAMRQRLYDRLLVYHLSWLRRRGFAKRIFRVRRGAVRQVWQGMARRVPLPERVTGLAVFEVHPDHFAVAYGLAGGFLEDVRLYRRDRRAGVTAMAEDLAAYYRANVRMLHADAELRALFEALDAVDPVFAAWRPGLPGEERPGRGGVSRPDGLVGGGRRPVWLALRQ